MSIVVITGSAGLVGSEAAKRFHQEGFDVIGIDNDMRAYFFGKSASTRTQRHELEKTLSRYKHLNADVRDADAMNRLFRKHGKSISVVIHSAAQPSHDWAAREPCVDFGVNALATLNLLEAARQHCPEAPFLFMSTNKVYGDTPNRLPLKELEKRWEIDAKHPYFPGIDETMSIDRTLHSLFGASKVAADVLVQEYGRYFGMKTVCFRAGCVTGPAHAGAELHGFLAYLMKCVVEGAPYQVFGYKGKQVRDHIHSHDLVSAFWEYLKAPRVAEVYNMGGGRDRSCSVLEAIEMCERMLGKKLQYEYVDRNRVGDHIWWISNVGRFEKDYPQWKYEYDLTRTLEEILETARRIWTTAS